MNLNTSINRSKINLLKKKNPRVFHIFLSNLIRMNHVCYIFFLLLLVGINSLLSKWWDQQSEFISLSECLHIGPVRVNEMSHFAAVSKFKKVTEVCVYQQSNFITQTNVSTNKQTTDGCKIEKQTNNKIRNEWMIGQNKRMSNKQRKTHLKQGFQA